VIEDVISGVRESFIDEGVDEQVLQELKQIWEAKLMASKAVELNPDPPEPQVPQINTHKAVSVNKGMQRSNVLLTNDLLQYNLYEIHCYWIFCIEHSVMVMHFIYIDQCYIFDVVTANVGNHFVQPSAGNTVPQTQPQAQQQQQQQAQAQTQAQSQQPSQPQQHTHPSMGTTLQQQQQQHSTTPVQQVVTASAVLERQVPIQITLPPQAGVPDGPQRILSIQVPASALQGEDLVIFH